METKTHTTPTWPCVVCGIDSSAVPETYPAAMLLQASGASVLDFLVNFSLLESDGAPSSAWSPVVDNRFICRPCLDVVVSCDQWNTTLHDGLCLLRRKIAGRGSVAAEPRLSVAPGHVDVPIKEEPSVVEFKDPLALDASEDKNNSENIAPSLSTTTSPTEPDRDEFQTPAETERASEQCSSSTDLGSRDKPKKDAKSAIRKKPGERMCPVCKVSTAEMAVNYPCHFEQEHPGLKFQRPILRFPHKCPVCPYETQHRNLLTNHLFAHGLIAKDEAYRYQCKECQEKFPSRSSLQTHEHKAHGAPMPAKCKMCGKEFTNKAALSVHKMHDHEGKKRTCGHCGEEFLYRVYHNHIVKCRPRTSVLCSICGAVYLTRAGLKGHLAAEHGEGNFVKKKFEETCGECGKVLKSKDSFLAHTFLQHGKELRGLKKFPCPDCDEVFYTKGYLNTHAMLHTDKKHTCSDCGYQTRYSQNLSKHAIKVHNKRLVKYRPLKQSSVPSEEEPVD